MNYFEKENKVTEISLEKLTEIEWKYIYDLKDELLEYEIGNEFDYFLGEDLILDLIANQYWQNPDLTVEDVKEKLNTIMNSNDLVSELGRIRVGLDLMVCDWCNRGKNV